MVALARYLNRVVAAFVLSLAFAAPVVAQTTELDRLFGELADPDQPAWQRIEDQIWTEWSKSGSPAMDLLLQRGRDAMQAGDMDAAIEHLTALVDHAPDFAEGWNARATAYFQAGLYGPSVSDIRQVLALNPRHFGALSGLGMILEETGNRERALTVYRAAKAIHPHSPHIKDAIARLEHETGGQEL